MMKQKHNLLLSRKISYFEALGMAQRIKWGQQLMKDISSLPVETEFDLEIKTTTDPDEFTLKITPIRKGD